MHANVPVLGKNQEVTNDLHDEQDENYSAQISLLNGQISFSFFRYKLSINLFIL